jgi:hypothetical protein
LKIASPIIVKKYLAYDLEEKKAGYNKSRTF